MNIKFINHYQLFKLSHVILENSIFSKLQMLNILNTNCFTNKDLIIYP